VSKDKKEKEKKVLSIFSKKHLNKL